MGIPDLRSWLRSAPPGTTIPAESLLGMIEEWEDAEPAPAAPPPEPIDLTWRERLWLVPAETRLSTREVLEAVGRGRSWLYKHLAKDRGAARLPHRKLDGDLVFTAGELRAWIRDHEETLAAGPMESVAADRVLRAV